MPPSPPTPIERNASPGLRSRFNTRTNSYRQPSLVGMAVSEEDASKILETFQDKDHNTEKTFSRMFVENVLSKYLWYNPHRDNPNAPSISKAWAYYEHVTLPRHFIGTGVSDTVFRRAEPGEREQETVLYSPLRTPQSSLIEWGTGVDLYFISLRFFGFLLTIAGLVNIASVIYYSSDNYDENRGQIGTLQPLLASAVCTNTVWVMCEDCEQRDWRNDQGRFAITQDGRNLVLKNNCELGTAEVGIVNYVTLIFLVVSVSLFTIYLRLREVRFDEDKVTTTDYSVCVTNPPNDALNHDEWRDYFEQFAEKQVTAVTITINNEKMLQKLINRRIFRDQLALKLPNGLNLDDEDALVSAIEQYNKEQEEEDPGCIGRILDWFVLPFFRLFGLFLPPHELHRRIDKLTDEIKDLQNERYDATVVYVTFETEEGQRAALSALATGKIDIMMNRTSAVPPGSTFRDRVLHVIKPTEPNAVRWLDLSAKTPTKMLMRFIILCLTCGVLALAGYVITLARNRVSPFLAAILVSLSNTIIPLIIKILMIFEPHSTEGGFQASLYQKITLCRWFLSALLFPIITPFTSSLGDRQNDLLRSVYAILLSDVWLTPLLRLADLFENVKKHLFAPRAKTQDEMNRYFQGTFYNIGERYTDFTKTLFVAFYFSAFFPLGFFFAALTITIQYFVDKFCLLRLWGWAPFVGSQLADLSSYFFAGSLIAYALSSSYTWAQFPFDNVCPTVESSGITTTFEGVTDLNGDLINENGIAQVPINAYKFCGQRVRDFNGFPFPPTPGVQSVKWMTDEQESLTELYGWSALVLVCLFIVLYFGKTIYSSVVSIFYGVYRVEGDSQNIDFSSNLEIYAYVPQIKQIGFSFPFLACDIDGIDQDLIGWNDMKHGYDIHNMIFDVPYEGMRRRERIMKNTRDFETILEHQQLSSTNEGSGTRSSQTNSSTKRAIFSSIVHYPTPWQVDLARKEREKRLMER